MDTQFWPSTVKSPSRDVSSPSRPLRSISPERMNQQGLSSSSPSLPSDLLQLQRKNSKGVSEVQSRVAFLNGMLRGQSPSETRSTATTSAALQRAILGREEAESTLANVSAQLSASQSRERQVSERLESVLEQLQSVKERQAHERAVFEKEVRKARKEAFRAGSAMVKIQEELKHSKNEIKGLKEEVKSEREAKEKAKQEAFERAYALAGLTEELEVLKDKLRSAETNHVSEALEARAQHLGLEEPQKEALNDYTGPATPESRRPKRSADDSSLTNEADSRSACDPTDTPPKRPRLSDDLGSCEEKRDTGGAISTPNDSIVALEAELKLERQLRIDAEDMVEFLQMECQFKSCSCRVAETQGAKYIHDHEWSASSVADKEIPESELYKNQAAADHHHESESPPSTPKTVQNPEPADEAAPPMLQSKTDGAQEQLMLTFSPSTGTFRTVPSPVRINAAASEDSKSHCFDATIAAVPVSAASMQENDNAEFYEEPSKLPCEPTSQAQGRSPLRLIQQNFDTHDQTTRTTKSTTTTVPIREPDEYAHAMSAAVPGTPVSREEALAQIRARRGKAQSTIRSASAGDALARAAGVAVTPVRSAARRIPSVQRTNSKSDSVKGVRRDLSAPVQLFR